MQEKYTRKSKTFRKKFKYDVFKDWSSKEFDELYTKSNFSDGPLKFLSQLQNLILDLKNVSWSTVDDSKKTGTLHAASKDMCFYRLQTSIENMVKFSLGMKYHQSPTEWII